MEPAIVIQPEGVRIPRLLPDIETFREWARSDDFPERGRIDWIGGEVEVDMSPEDITTHGTLKSAVSRQLGNLIEDSDRGVVLIDRARLSSPSGDLSVEPDVVVILTESMRSGRVRLIPKAGAREGRFIEIEGAADLVVECVSDSSKKKDRERLPARYFAAGVREYWVADGRVDPVALVLYRRGRDRYVETRPDSDGFRRSQILGRSVRIVRIPMELGLVRFRMDVRP
ncbi:MAG: Uma2 family endonuclease [Planctomycetes bacterium]|nr:Uma2 family endonuclease [Planctomycetota bacterium]